MGLGVLIPPSGSLSGPRLKLLDSGPDVASTLLGRHYTESQLQKHRADLKTLENNYQNLALLLGLYLHAYNTYSYITTTKSVQTLRDVQTEIHKAVIQTSPRLGASASVTSLIYQEVAEWVAERKRSTSTGKVSNFVPRERPMTFVQTLKSGPSKVGRAFSRFLETSRVKKMGTLTVTELSLTADIWDFLYA